MKCLLTIVITLAAAVGIAYGGLRLFSRLSGVDAFEVVSWQASRRQLPILLVMGFFYLFSMICLMVLMEMPVTLVAMNSTHEGALRGYTDASGVKLYAPADKDYRIYPRRNYVPAAERFSDAFDVVAFYRSPRFDWWEDADAQVRKPWMGALVLFFICLIFVACYMVLYTYTVEYLGTHDPSRTLTYGEIHARFRPITGLSFPLIAGIAIAVVMTPWFLGGYMVHKIKSGYQEQFGHLQKELRSELLANAAPGREITGKVVARTIGYEQELMTEAEASRRGGGNKWKTVSLLIYTIEFPDLIRHTPIYLSITRPNAANDPVVQKLEALAPQKEKPGSEQTGGEARPLEQGQTRTAKFLVNDDTSVSLADEKGQ
ncbi:MAG: hypothetical protein OEW15_05855 [Nitrospirota bacterium]|nr:hypothetical protein [Nitrospirota bacterium]